MQGFLLACEVQNIFLLVEGYEWTCYENKWYVCVCVVEQTVSVSGVKLTIHWILIDNDMIHLSTLKNDLIEQLKYLKIL